MQLGRLDLIQIYLFFYIILHYFIFFMNSCIQMLCVQKVYPELS